MIYSLRGLVVGRGDNFAVVENNGVGFKVFMPKETLNRMPTSNNQEVKLFSYQHVREDALELYGFLGEEERRFFEMLISVSGVGPKTALGIMSVDKLENLMAAILENRPDLMTRASGVGRKTAERVILELRNKIKTSGPKERTAKMDADLDLEEALVGLGYKRNEVKDAIQKVSGSEDKLENRLKYALKELSSRQRG